MKKLISCLMVLTLLISMMSVFAITGTAAKSADIDIWDGSVSTSLSGSGTSDDPYLIQSGADLAYLAKIVNDNPSDWNKVLTYDKYYKLTKSIDLNNIEWTPIGKDCTAALTNVTVFCGYFDGDGYVIYNLLVGSNNMSYASAGLFGAAYYGSISNLGIESGTVYVNTAGYVGAGIVARTRVAPIIDNCYNKATVVKNFSGSWCMLGGIVGNSSSHNTKITNCVNYGTIDGSIGGEWNSGNNCYAGICANALYSSGAPTISNCYNLGNVVGHANSRAGGLIGHANGSVTVENCYSSGEITSSRNNNTGYLFGIVDAAGTYTNLTAYTSGHAASTITYSICGADSTYVVNVATNTTDTLVVPTESIFEDFLVATNYGTTLGVVEKYDDIATYRGATGYTAPTKDGLVFAGWFTDARCTTAIAKTTVSGSAYAKFVDADALTVNFQVTAGTTASSTSTNLRLLTTVESTDLACVGFSITYGNDNVSKTTTTVYKSVKGSTNADTFNYGPQYFSGVSEYFATYTITSVPTAAFNTAFRVAPTWTTLDGTVVMGATANVVISDSFAG
ncbi:MAG: InlB B-repeat-containing protein [Clostridia bacterium]|nr:InlB B-repeat-containing protein [Clostridia bacterium]